MKKKTNSDIIIIIFNNHNNNIETEIKKKKKEVHFTTNLRNRQNLCVKFRRTKQKIEENTKKLEVVFVLGILCVNLCKFFLLINDRIG